MFLNNKLFLNDQILIKLSGLETKKLNLLYCGGHHSRS